MIIGNINTDREYACPNCIKGNISCREITHGVFIAKCNKCGWEKKV